MTAAAPDPTPRRRAPARSRRIAAGPSADEAREGLQAVQVEVAERGARAEINVRYPRHDERGRD